MKTPILKFKQGQHEYISFVTTFENLERLGEVLIYQVHPQGYQRAPNPVHINRIKKFVLGNVESFKLPTSIILGTSRKNIDPFIEKSELEVSKIDLNSIHSKVFRIVDGQHRLKGLSKALEEVKPEQRNSILEYKFNVVCIVTDDNNRSVELDILPI